MVLIARVEKEFGTRCRVFEEQEREARTRENDEDRLVTMAVSVRDREAEPVVSVKKVDRGSLSLRNVAG